MICLNLPFKSQSLLHRLQYIVDNRAAAIMHEHGEKTSGKPAAAQARKFAAFSETLFVNATTITCKKMAGNCIHDHHAIVCTCFDVLIFYLSF